MSPFTATAQANIYDGVNHTSRMAIRVEDDRIVVTSCAHDRKSAGFGYLHFDGLPPASASASLVKLIASMWVRGGPRSDDFVWECPKPEGRERAGFCDWDAGWDMPGFGGPFYAWVFAGLTHVQVAEIGNGNIPALSGN